MSENTSKKSILTRAMEAVAAKENDGTPETDETISTKTVYKRIAVATGIVMTGGLAITLVAKQIMKMGEVETASEETPED